MQTQHKSDMAMTNRLCTAIETAMTAEGVRSHGRDLEWISSCLTALQIEVAQLIASTSVDMGLERALALYDHSSNSARETLVKLIRDIEKRKRGAAL